ncbi:MULTISPECIES: glycosyltransferase family 2 protein [Gallibacterium]|uniref:Glycosyltransferase n=1 Tax=Gallibacterium genomosp. 3 TaxID=505345 RepID=A0A1A7PRG3_9PAST|nr:MULTISPECIES: glycosyltransferase family 2 protein [Gallibacterium]MDA3979689.1 glycosyltransferase family 2 protein [Gallibacterium sp. AGMB14963]OBX04639.1 glycosyltransferase [Gallibacterium genomosp. 3]
MSSPRLAVALIVKNEAENLISCLESIKDWVDEIVIVDSGSTDSTLNIAHQYTNKVFSHPHWQGFGKQRQIAQSYIESEYVLWLDADEIITPELKQSILSAIQQNKPNTIYQIGRLSEVFGREIRHSGWYPDFVTRLYRTQDTQYNDSLVHEKVIQPKGFTLEKLNGDLLHYTYKDLHHYLVKSANYAKAWADQKETQGKTSSLAKGLSHALGCFIKMYLLKAGFLDGKQGFLLAILSSHSTFIKYADLWIRKQNH